MSAAGRHDRSIEQKARSKGINALRIYLTGFMGCGKTTIGRVLAASLGWEFFDLDQIIEQKLRQSIPETFQLSGEGEFRKRERESLQLLTRDPAVIATG